MYLATRQQETVLGLKTCSNCRDSCCRCPALTLRNIRIIEKYQFKQSWARDNCLASRQRPRASETSQGPEKIRNLVRRQCLNGVAITNIVKWQLQTTLWPENMITLSRQNCRVPSSEFK